MLRRFSLSKITGLVSGDQEKSDTKETKYRQSGSLSPKRSAAARTVGSENRKRSNSSSRRGKRGDMKSRSMDKINERRKLKQADDDSHYNGASSNANWDNNGTPLNLRMLQDENLKKPSKQSSARSFDIAAFESSSESESDPPPEIKHKSKRKSEKKKKKKKKSKTERKRSSSRDSSRHSSISERDAADDLFSPVVQQHEAVHPQAGGKIHRKPFQVDDHEEDSSIDDSHDGDARNYQHVSKTSQESDNSLQAKGRESEGCLPGGAREIEVDRDIFSSLQLPAGSNTETCDLAEIIANLENENTKMQDQLMETENTKNALSQQLHPHSEGQQDEAQYRRFMTPSRSQDGLSHRKTSRKTPVDMQSVLSGNSDMSDMLAQLHQEVQELEKKARIVSPLPMNRPEEGPPRRLQLVRRDSMRSVGSTKSLMDLQAEVAEITSKSTNKPAPLKSSLKGGSKQIEIRPDARALLQIRQNGNIHRADYGAAEMVRPPFAETQSAMNVGDTKSGKDTMSNRSMNPSEIGSYESSSGYSEHEHLLEDIAITIATASGGGGRPQMPRSISTPDVLERGLRRVLSPASMRDMSSKADPSGHTRATAYELGRCPVQSVMPGNRSTGKPMLSRDPDLEEELLKDAHSGLPRNMFSVSSQCFSANTSLSSGCFLERAHDTNTMIFERCDSPDLLPSDMNVSTHVFEVGHSSANNSNAIFNAEKSSLGPQHQDAPTDDICNFVVKQSSALPDAPALSQQEPFACNPGSRISVDLDGAIEKESSTTRSEEELKEGKRNDSNNWLSNYIAGKCKNNQSSEQTRRSLDPDGCELLEPFIISNAVGDPPEKLRSSLIFVDMEKPSELPKFPVAISFSLEDQDLVSQVKNPSCLNSKGSNDDGISIQSQLKPPQVIAFDPKEKKEDDSVTMAKGFNPPNPIGDQSLKRTEPLLPTSIHIHRREDEPTDIRHHDQQDLELHDMFDCASMAEYSVATAEMHIGKILSPLTETQPTSTTSKDAPSRQNLAVGNRVNSPLEKVGLQKAAASTSPTEEESVSFGEACRDEQLRLTRSNRGDNSYSLVSKSMTSQKKDRAGSENTDQIHNQVREVGSLLVKSSSSETTSLKKLPELQNNPNHAVSTFRKPQISPDSSSSESEIGDSPAVADAIKLSPFSRQRDFRKSPCSKKNAIIAVAHTIQSGPIVVVEVPVCGEGPDGLNTRPSGRTSRTREQKRKEGNKKRPTQQSDDLSDSSEEWNGRFISRRAPRRRSKEKSRYPQNTRRTTGNKDRLARNLDGNTHEASAGRECYVPNRLQTSKLNARLKDLKERKRLLEGENKLRIRNRSADGLRRSRSRDRLGGMKRQGSVGTLTVQSTDGSFQSNKLSENAMETSRSGRRRSKDTFSRNNNDKEGLGISGPAVSSKPSRSRRSRSPMYSPSAPSG